MKYLHIWPNDKFTNAYIEFINKNFNNDEHLFLILGEGVGAKIKPFKNVVEIPSVKKGMGKIFKEMRHSKQIYLHSLFTPRIIEILLMQPWLWKKCRWIVWGGDLYQYRNLRNTLKEKLYEAGRKVVIRNFNYIVGLVKGDYILAKEWYKVKGKYLYARYISPISYDFLDSLPIGIEKDAIYIQIGNSGDPSNQHLEALNMLKQYSKENIKIFLPLSYGGTENYKNEVVKYGKEVFGDKFVPLIEFFPADEYAKYLSSIDIAVFNNNRQQALGNIFALLYLDKKVYIRSDTTMWENIKETLDLNVFKTDLISNLSYDEFVEKKIDDNKVKVNRVVDEKELVKIWKVVFGT